MPFSKSVINYLIRTLSLLWRDLERNEILENDINALIAYYCPLFTKMIFIVRQF